jgi:EF-P beta-lysylation protein EpmB
MMRPGPICVGETLAASAPSASAPLDVPGTASLQPTWQRLLSEAVRDPAELLRMLELPETLLPGAMAAVRQFPLLVPRGFVALMQRGCADDPLLAQVLPLGVEMDTVPGFRADPLDERGCAAVAGMLHKYHGRALLVTTGACAVHCRYCFRRHFPYDGLPRGQQWWGEACAYLANDPSLHEIILSGGDPLILPDAQLAQLAQALAAVPHVTRIRIHTRLPIVLPQRIDENFLRWFTGSRLQPVLVVHANHPRELSQEVLNALSRVRQAGATVLNQSVLLAGINDDASVLSELSQRLFSVGALPYYLHCLDRVQGAAHFLVDDARSRQIMGELAALLPGYLVPRLVREEPGKPGKTTLV